MIYVGETLKTFKERMDQHKKEDAYTLKRGQFKVRLGTIPCSFNFGDKNKEHFMTTLENAVIQNIKDKARVKLVNKRQMKDFTIYFDIEILNV